MKTLSAPQTLRLQLKAYTRVNLTLVGCGGTGSHLASGLAAIAQALADKHVHVDMLFIDPDLVEPGNVGRQLFADVAVGRPKASVVAARLNAAYGLRIGAAVRPIDERDTFVHVEPAALNLVVGAVDNPAARALMAASVAVAQGKLWWLDCGNENHSGQVALGNCSGAAQLRGAVGLGLLDRLPCPLFVYPDLAKTPAAPKLAKPSKNGKSAPRNCSVDLATGEQSLMVNRMAAGWALTLLHEFLLGELRWFALAFDLTWGGTKAYTLDLPTLSEVTKLSPAALEGKGKPG